MPKDVPDNEQKDTDEKLLEHPSYEELMHKLDEAEKKANENWERVLRMQADNENLLRRTERDVANAHKYGLEKFVLELLPIIDSLELCLNNVSKEMKKSASAMIEGVSLTLKMFYTALEKF